MNVTVIEDLTDTEAKTLRSFVDAQVKLYLVDDAEQLEMELDEVA